jgi:hypothetical protein
MFQHEVLHSIPSIARDHFQHGVFPSNPKDSYIPAAGSLPASAHFHAQHPFQSEGFMYSSRRLPSSVSSFPCAASLPIRRIHVFQPQAPFQRQLISMRSIPSNPKDSCIPAAGSLPASAHFHAQHPFQSEGFISHGNREL